MDAPVPLRGWGKTFLLLLARSKRRSQLAPQCQVCWGPVCWARWPGDPWETNQCVEGPATIFKDQDMIPRLFSIAGCHSL